MYPNQPIRKRLNKAEFNLQPVDLPVNCQQYFKAHDGQVRFEAILDRQYDLNAPPASLHRVFRQFAMGVVDIVKPIPLDQLQQDDFKAMFAFKLVNLVNPPDESRNVVYAQMCTFLLALRSVQSLTNILIAWCKLPANAFVQSILIEQFAVLVKEKEPYIGH